MPFSSDKARSLLRKVRDIMAVDLNTTERMDQITAAVAAQLRCEVCSVYAVQSDKLVMVGVHGLDHRAIGGVQLRVGQGLVGETARTAKVQNLEDALTSSQFYRVPGLDEERLHGFLCLPIVNAGNCVGVMVVQQRAKSKFPDEECEALETVATVLAHWMFPDGEFSTKLGAGKAVSSSSPLRISVTGLAEGAVVGNIVLHRRRLSPTATLSENSLQEKEKLDAALTRMQAEVDDILVHPALLRDGDHREMFEAFRLFAHDRGWIRRITEGIDSGLTAEAAVASTGDAIRAQMRKISDPILRDRMYDIDDLAQHLMHHLQGIPIGSARKLPPNSVVVARSLGPASLLEYDRKNLTGLILGEGGSGSHIALLARSYGIPAVSGAERILEQAENGDLVMIDAIAGVAYLRPPPQVAKPFMERVKLIAEHRKQLDLNRHLKAITKDEHPIEIKINCGLLIDLDNFEDSGGTSIGLFRTEVLFMAASHLPSITEQRQLYQAVMDSVGNKSVHFRTLDVGGDKVLPYLRNVDQENPALGWRALRFSLDRPALLKMQLRALIQAADGRPLEIMFPMVGITQEFVQAKQHLEIELARHERMGRKRPATLRVGAMIEVPSILWQLSELLPVVDFVAVGTNDLFQYIFATDRNNSKVHGRFDSLGYTGIKALKFICTECKQYNVPVDLCGDLASNYISAMALIGIGYTSLSMPAKAVGSIKQAIRASNLTDLQRFVDLALNDASVNLRKQLQQYSLEIGIDPQHELTDQGAAAEFS